MEEEAPYSVITCILRSFFENKTRFPAQFEQHYRILEEYGRGDNSMVAGKVYSALWCYHQRSQKDPKENSDTYSPRENRPHTYGELAETWFQPIVYCLHAERMGTDCEFMPEDEAVALRDRIVNEIQGMDKIPRPGFAYNLSYEEELEVRSSPLVISPGWQAALRQMGSPAGRKRTRRVGELRNGFRRRQHANAQRKAHHLRQRRTRRAHHHPDGYQVPLNLDDDGKVIIPTPSEIEEMIENGEGEYVGHPADNNQPQTPLTEEEWKMQEARRQQDEEAARQQE